MCNNKSNEQFNQRVLKGRTGETILNMFLNTQMHRLYLNHCVSHAV